MFNVPTEDEIYLSYVRSGDFMKAYLLRVKRMVTRGKIKGDEFLGLVMTGLETVSNSDHFHGLYKTRARRSLKRLEQANTTRVYDQIGEWMIVNPSYLIRFS